MNELAPLIGSSALPAIVTSAGEGAQLRFLEFFAASIRNPHTRRAYASAVGEFLAWCEERGVASIAAVKPLHVAAYIEALSRSRAAPTAKLRLAAIRRLFDWLVIGQVMPTNPAASVRGPAHSVKRGKTPVLAPEEARALLDSIDVSTPAGLRDRALIGLMVFSFARIGAARSMKVEDVYVQHRRLWLRLHEKGGRVHEMPCHHSLLDGVIDQVVEINPDAVEVRLKLHVARHRLQRAKQGTDFGQLLVLRYCAERVLDGDQMLEALRFKIGMRRRGSSEQPIGFLQRLSILGR
jgi:site-specific recombinase XerC